MTFKTILVHVDTDRRSGARIELAAQLAKGWGAHLIGLHVSARSHIPSHARADLNLQLLEQLRLGSIVVKEQLAAAFEAVAIRFELADPEMQVVEGDAVSTITLAARFADLVIVGQHDPDERGGTVEPNFPEIVALTVGRPVMVIPFAGNFATVGHQILIAWDASREAMRAVSDALPVLQQAEAVTILTVNPRNGISHDGAESVAMLVRYLARHDVKAASTSYSGVQINVANFILSQAADRNADLIVMGAYGHARIREIVFGGVTQSVMRHMTVPTLMSHI
jgi:nucleotide-binding universal stress UspA family protein